MLEKWKLSVDKGKTFGVLLTDLSKAFDCLSHELIIAKLNAYGFSLSALKLMQSYLWERKQRTKINQPYSSWEETLFGVPQGSILGPILFNIFLSVLFLVDFASYAGDNTITMQVAILMRSYFLCKNLLNDFLNGSLIIKWKLMKTNVI